MKERVGDNIMRSTTTFTRVNGTTGTVGDAALAFRPDIRPDALNDVFEHLRGHNLLGGSDGRNGRTIIDRFIHGGDRATAGGERVDEGDDAEGGQSSVEANSGRDLINGDRHRARGVDADLGNTPDLHRRLAAITQDLATFGVDGAARIELRHRPGEAGIDLFAA